MELAQSLQEVYNVSDPVRPLPSGDPRYVDCTPVRGNEDVVEQMLKTISWSDTYTAQLFTGHRGSGKSTELLRLKARLEEQGFRVLYFEADEDLDLNDLKYTDLLLSIARRVVSDLYEAGIKLREGLLEEIEDWFSETLYTEEQQREIRRELAAEARLGIGLPENLPLVARLLARVTGQIQTGHTVKEEIRRRLDPQISQLLANINLLLKAANVKLRQNGEEGLVLIVDNLDRIVFRDLGDGRTTHTALYVEHGEQLRDLDSHVIYTVPISLMYSVHANAVRAIYPDCPVLPMIKVRDRNSNINSEGLDYLRRILAARINVDMIFKSDAVTYLCKACGGHPRDLMILVRQACVYAPGDLWPKPIDEAVARRAESQLVATYGRMIPEERYPLLARVHLNKSVKSDEAHELMLYNLSVLEYLNGMPPWHDVHPAVMKLPKFQTALDAARQEMRSDLEI